MSFTEIGYIQSKIIPYFKEFKIISDKKIFFICGTILKRRIKNYGDIKMEEVNKIIGNNIDIMAVSKFFDNNCLLPKEKQGELF